ncbi:N-acetyltransferase family protein [Streptomyces turgidiscabies]|uniref:Acetyltransferase, GNAT family n=1 Tax=Streptomyces turgidiscabies (strain Car8) TaxID=698760 RepID=L7F398_STRT8|nr:MULTISPECIES: GNAT family N-acetyltransferase [Streptomyces]ELP65080.1 acetyltransferase, GNAT family [Streptomyces turgidiscabies Car8]MDX3499967.1 GNAT family N-acetyltransferase [Streptomyces turgidiscabies]GAQ77007.1 putative phosphinothricin acetyltransferase [Streptomyces turgidiscabies]
MPPEPQQPQQPHQPYDAHEGQESQTGQQGQAGQERPAGPGPFVRAARPEDDEALGRLDRATWSTLHAVTPRPRPPYTPFFRENSDAGDHLVAVTGDGRVVGYVRLARPTPLASNAHVLQIQGLAVSDEARGTGVGRLLIRGAMAEARRRGALRLSLRVLGHNEPARRLYESEGFVVEGVQPREFLLDGEFVDDVLMGRSL